MSFPNFTIFSSLSDVPIRRPRSMKPPPLPKGFSCPQSKLAELPKPEDPKLRTFYRIFNGEQSTETEVFHSMDDFVSFEAEGPEDHRKMVVYLLDMIMECSVNVVPIFKALYVLTQDTEVGADIRGFVYSELELRFKTWREKIFSDPDGRKFRNFVLLMMAVVHHYRNITKSPLHDLIEALQQLSVELAHFNFFGDVLIYVLLMMRVHYYTTLPPAIKEDTLPAVQQSHREWNKAVLARARNIVRMKLAEGRDLPPIHRRWITLFLEARNSPNVEQDEDLMTLYKDLPGFEKLLPEELNIKLPHYSQRDDSLNIRHISEYVTYEEAPAQPVP